MAPRARYGPTPDEEINWVVPRLPFTPHLFRLDPKLRERIYHYIFSNMLIEVGSRSDANSTVETIEYLNAIHTGNLVLPRRPERKVTNYLTAREDNPESRSKDLYQWAGIALVCWKLHEECSLFVFKLSTVHIGAGYVPRLLRCLRAPQKAAVSTIQFESRALQFPVPGDFERLDAFKGLKRVVVKNNREWYKLTELGKEAWMGKMREHAKNNDLEVVFDESE